MGLEDKGIDWEAPLYVRVVSNRYPCPKKIILTKLRGGTVGRSNVHNSTVSTCDL